MNDALTTYLQDHLAGALHAIELLKAMRDHHAGEPLGQFAAQLLVVIEADRDVLAGLIERLGTAPGGVKEWGAWAGGESEPAETETWLRRGSRDLRSA